MKTMKTLFSNAILIYLIIDEFLKPLDTCRKLTSHPFPTDHIISGEHTEVVKLSWRHVDWYHTLVETSRQPRYVILPVIQQR
jgi:hypothetical protein